MRPLTLTLASLAAASALAVTACDDTPPPEADALASLSGDPGKADSATPIAIVGGLTLEDANALSLPVVPAYVGLILLAPAGADVTVQADSKAIATRVTVFGPRAADGSYPPAIGSAPGSVRFTAPAEGAYLVVPQPRYVGQSGTATVRTTCAGTSCLGQCGAAKAPTLAKRKWVHTTGSKIVKALGDPRHRAYDQVVGPDDVPELSARFTYGAVDKDLEDEDVDLWIRSCPGWTKLATARTDDDGIARVQLAAPLAPGEYNLLWVVGGDATTAPGMLAVWEPGQTVVVSDIDGTLTINDAQVFKEIFLGTDPTAYTDADQALWTVRRKGYHVQYLTGRPELLGRMTKSWLAAHRFPPGPTKLTDKTLEALPSESGVGDFKTGILEHLVGDVGLWVYGAFGNATTDISAYQANDIPDDHDFIIGAHAGERGTTAVSSYTALLPTLRAWPEAPAP
ncbi:MAG: hypothetical protein U1F43_21030 [Myxococcota bacterium]